jgi:putative MATE family efflux protein
VEHKIAKDLTTGNHVGNVLFLVWPIVITSLLQTTLGIADTIMVGRLGTQPLAAVGMGRFILMVVIIFILAVSTGAQALVARYTGAKDKEQSTCVVDQALILSIIVTALLATIGLLFSPLFLRLLGAEPEIITLGIPYLRIIFAGLLFMGLNFVINAILQGAGDTRTPLKIMALINTLNIILNYLLIFGIGFFPQMGIIGAAWGTVIARSVGGGIGLWVLVSDRFAARTLLHKRFKLQLTLISKIIRIGFPAGVQGLVRSGAAMILMRFVAMTVHSTYAVAAFSIGFQIEAISFMPGLAFGAAAMTLVGQNLGARKPERAKQSSKSATALAALFMSVMGLLLFFFARPIISIFSTNAYVVDIGADFLRIMAYSQPFLALVMVFSGGLQGAGDTMTPLKYSLIHGWFVRLPLVYILAFLLDFQTTGIWWAMTISTITQGLATWWYFQQGRWQQIRI